MSGSNKNPSLLITAIVGIVCSIIATILYERFIPFLSWLATFISNLVNSFHSGFIDRQYAHASFNNFDRTENITLLLILSVTFYSIIKTSIEKYFKSLHLINFRFNLGPYLAKVVYTLNAFFLYFIMTISLINLVGNGISFEAKKSFYYNMALKSISLSKEQISNFNRRWSLMSSKSDYDSIIKDLDNISIPIEK